VSKQLNASLCIIADQVLRAISTGPALTDKCVASEYGGPTNMAATKCIDSYIAGY